MIKIHRFSRSLPAGCLFQPPKKSAKVIGDHHPSSSHVYGFPIEHLCKTPTRKKILRNTTRSEIFSWFFHPKKSNWRKSRGKAPALTGAAPAQHGRASTFCNIPRSNCSSSTWWSASSSPRKCPFFLGGVAIDGHIEHIIYVSTMSTIVCLVLIILCIFSSIVKNRSTK